MQLQDPQILNRPYFKPIKNSIYRFVPFNLYLVESLLTEKLFFGGIDFQNDPMEALHIPSYTIGENYPPINKKNVEILEQFAKDIPKNYGICCFSERINNSLLWAHYADGARGLCLVFDKELLVNSLNKADSGFKISKVNYKKPPYFNLNSRINFTNERLERILYYKVKDWEYEKEFRIIKKVKNNNRKFNFQPESLKAIILGDRFKFDLHYETLMKIIALPQYEHVVVAKIYRNMDNQWIAVILNNK